MEKKHIIGLIVIFVCAVICIFVSIDLNKKVENDDTDYVTQIFIKHKDDVDKGVSELTGLDAFKPLEEVEKVEIARRLLVMYQNAGIIRNLHYDEDSLLFTYEYASGEIEGALGGLKLRPFDPNLN